MHPVWRDQLVRSLLIAIAALSFASSSNATPVSDGTIRLSFPIILYCCGDGFEVLSSNGYSQGPGEDYFINFPITGGDTTSIIDTSGGFRWIAMVNSSSYNNVTASNVDFNFLSNTVTADLLLTEIANGVTTYQSYLGHTLFDLAPTGALTYDPSVAAILEPVLFGSEAAQGQYVGTIVDISPTEAPETATLWPVFGGLLALAFAKLAHQFVKRRS